MPGGSALGVDEAIVIDASPVRIAGAFFDPSALAVWWQAVRSVTTPRPLGVYAIEWAPGPTRDDVFGLLGGVFHGTVLEYRPAAGSFFLADCYWLPPESDPIGPMGLEVTCTRDGGHTRLRVLQTGYEDTARWSRYYRIVGPGWRLSLQVLKRYLEKGPQAASRLT
jgi:uncharacterized protein YndB with AHSA1/START domain